MVDRGLISLFLKELVCKELRPVHSLFGMQLQQSLDQVLGLIADRDLVFQVVIILLDILKELLIGEPVEGQLTLQHLIKNDPDSPQIDLVLSDVVEVTVVIENEHLGGHVRHGPDLGLTNRLPHFRAPKVPDLDDVSILQNIRHLYIAMHHQVLSQLYKAIHNLLHVKKGLLLIDVLLIRILEVLL